MKKITISDIAKEAKVSKATVSLVLNNKPISVSDKTRENILKISKELNYIPNSIARSLITNKTETIGIILPDIVNPFFSEIARAIEDTAGKLNYNVMLCNSDNNVIKEEKYTKLLVSKLIAGTIFISGGNSKKSLEILKENGIPVVFVDRYVEPFRDYSGVFCSNSEGINEAVTYLYNKNMKSIAFVTGSMELETSKLRLTAYAEITKKLKIYDKSLICESTYSIEGGVAATEKLLSSNKKIDAIIYCSDVMAFGGIKVLKRKKLKIPKDISVIGYDDIFFCEYVEPELTTIRQPIYEMGKEACKLLISIINGKTVNKKINLKSKLIIRGTA
ncbi:LacI family transcriptional regulator [Clostridium algifaecis]|uniref:LacI family transcriptional regulator n=1 Tax=Clostridium algifaecis TaxID=1472040 RepID=A0ABS4KTX2_9CLOT|nr:LacI family transcriptional regulator [Clostridium algifaecis]